MSLLFVATPPINLDRILHTPSIVSCVAISDLTLPAGRSKLDSEYKSINMAH